MIRETENPFGEEEEEAARAMAGPSSSRASPPSTQTTGRIESFSYLGSSKDKKKKDKDKKGRKGKPFDLEVEKEAMKTTVADASMAATGLLNALQSINREQERISENQLVLDRFEACKSLRRRVLRYVSLWYRHGAQLILTSFRSIMSSLSSGSAAFCTPTTSLSLLS